MGREPFLNAAFIRCSASRAYLWAMRILLITMALTGVFGLPSDVPVRAQSDQSYACPEDTGEIKPLPNVLKTVKKKVPGQILDVQLDCGKQPTYRIRVRQDKGNVVLAIVNARTGRILSEKGAR